MSLGLRAFAGLGGSGLGYSYSCRAPKPPSTSYPESSIGVGLIVESGGSINERVWTLTPYDFADWETLDTQALNPEL